KGNGEAATGRRAGRAAEHRASGVQGVGKQTGADRGTAAGGEQQALQARGEPPLEPPERPPPERPGVGPRPACKSSFGCVYARLARRTETRVTVLLRLTG